MEAFIVSLARILDRHDRSGVQYIVAKPAIVTQHELYRRAMQSTVRQFNAAADTVLNEPKQSTRPDSASD